MRALFAYILLIPFSLSVQANGLDYVAGEVIVKLKGSSNSYDTYAFMGKAQQAKGMVLKNSFSKMNMYHYKTNPGQTMAEALADLQNDPSVEYVEPNYILSKKDVAGFEQTFSSSDVEAMSGGYLATSAAIHATDVWSSLSVPAAKPIVAVIDTGLDITHSVFADSNAVWVNTDEVPGNGIDDDGNGYVDDINGWNYVTSSGTMYDDDGHGTHVSGIVLGVGQNIFSGPFSESKVHIMPLKFLDGNGSGSTSNAIAAIYYAVNNGARVLNNSWGGTNYSAALHEALTFAYNEGIAVVAAAGNSSYNNDVAPMYPASYDVPNIMSIAATTDSDYLASFSNYGSGSVHLGSPGVFVLSTIPGGGYGSSSGTSMAAPFVSGVAALMLVESPNMMGYQIKQIILGESDYVSPLTSKVTTEARVNVSNAVNLAKTAAVDYTLPAYEMQISDRNLASSLSGAGGCGTVTKLYQSYRSGKGGGPRGPSGPTNTWYIVIVLGLISLPVLFIRYLKSKAPEARRKYKRFQVESDVKVQVGEKELVGSISTISVGGAQLNTDALLEDGSVVAMVISSPDGSEQVKVDGHIVWSEAKKAYGVQFEEQPNSIKSMIQKWTKALKPT